MCLSLIKEVFQMSQRLCFTAHRFVSISSLRTFSRAVGEWSPFTTGTWKGKEVVAAVPSNPTPLLIKRCPILVDFTLVVSVVYCGEAPEGTYFSDWMSGQIKSFPESSYYHLVHLSSAYLLRKKLAHCFATPVFNHWVVPRIKFTALWFKYGWINTYLDVLIQIGDKTKLNPLGHCMCGNLYTFILTLLWFGGEGNHGTLWTSFSAITKTEFDLTDY